MSLEPGELQPLLSRLAVVLGGTLTEAQIDEIVGTASELALDEEREFEFRVRYLEGCIPFRIVLFRDDTDTLDVYFLSPVALAERIKIEMMGFAEQYRRSET